MKALIDGVGTLPFIIAGGIDSSGRVSFSMVNSIDAMTRGFEAIVNMSSGKRLFAEVLEALKGNLPAWIRVRGFASATGMLASAPPAVLAEHVTVSLRRLRFDKRFGASVGRVRVRNDGPRALPAPIAVALVLDGSHYVVLPHGFTYATTPRRIPFLFVLSSGSLRPGQSVEQVITIDNPDRDKLVIRQSKVLAGAWAP